VTDVYHLLGLLESDAVAMVADNATASQIAELEALHEELEAALGDRAWFFRVNEEFHMLVLAIADNRWRSQIVTDLRKVMKLNRHSSLFRQGRLEELLAEHRKLMAALKRRDATAAAALSLQHFRNGLAAAVPGKAAEVHHASVRKRRTA
jgi:DNA-binding GntR family transcriptional regulator